MTDIKENLKKVHERVLEAAQKAQRDPGAVRVMAVTKRHSETAIREAASLGMRDFGENFLQEAADKIESLRDLELVWHFIGRIQSNKTRPIAKLFDWVHTVDRLKTAQRLNDHRPDSLPPLNVCIQVNVAGDDIKAGIAPNALNDLVQQVSQLPRLCLRGLMCIPPHSDSPCQQRAYFATLRRLFDEVAMDSPDWDTLSMGMSGDVESAIAEGSTFVRIGTAIFGSRR